jgi:hypothetical protein
MVIGPDSSHVRGRTIHNAFREARILLEEIADAALDGRR